MLELICLGGTKTVPLNSLESFSPLSMQPTILIVRPLRGPFLYSKFDESVQVGAGPSGLVLALTLLHHGIPVRIIDNGGRQRLRQWSSAIMVV